MNANNPKAPPPAPRPGPICPNCERSGGRHFPACPLEGAPYRVSLDVSPEPDRSALVVTDRKGRVVERHEIPGTVTGRVPTVPELQRLPGRLTFSVPQREAGHVVKPGCATCGGEGTITVQDGSATHLAGGQVRQHLERCPSCGGTGGH